MAIFPIHQPCIFAVGLLGNITSFMVYLAPLPTFLRVYRKKSTEGFHSCPYAVALCTAMLWIYYAIHKSDAYLLITINLVGCVIETIYIIIYLIYAPKKPKILTLKLLVSLNGLVFCSITLVSHFLFSGSTRVRLLGWICVAFSVLGFAAPLSILREVIRTKSVEFMPLSLSLFLTLTAVIWLGYGVLIKDLYVALPNILGFSFGVLQIIIYMIYRNSNKVVKEEKLPEHVVVITRLSSVKSREVHPVCYPPDCDENNERKDQNVKNKTGSDKKSNKEGKDQNAKNKTAHDRKSTDASNQV